MDEPYFRIADVNDKLSKEVDKLGILQNSLGKSNQLTENMLKIVTSFENRLSKLEETITPVYLETGNLQRRHENIEKTMNTLDHVIEYYHVAEEVEPTIREGPANDLNTYIEAMDKAKKAVQFFNKNNPGSPEMSQITTLYESGKDILEREFKNSLSRHSKPVPAVLLLDILATDDDFLQEETQQIDHLPPKVKKELSLMADWIMHCGYNSDFMKAYSQVRSNMLVKSLQTLKDHLKTGSKDSAGLSLSASLNSPALVNKHKVGRDTPSKRAMKRMEFVRKASSALMKQSLAQLESAGLKRASAATPDVRGDEVLEVDIDFYITGVSALLKLIQSEWTLMQGIIPSKLQFKVFDSLIQSAMESIIKEGELISNNIRRATARHDHTSVLALFPVLRLLRSEQPEFTQVLKGCDATTKNKLPSLILTLDETGYKALMEFVDSIKSDPGKQSNMPPDGTVHELTSNTLVFLQQLLEFEDTAGAMLTSQDSKVKASAEVKRRKLAEYITKVLSALGLNLNNKSEIYNDDIIKSIFMLNNYNYILKSLKTKGMLGVVIKCQPQVEEFYDDQLLEHKRLYSASWSKVLHYIKPPKGDSQQKLPSPEHKLKDKDRQAIKDKFSGFNKEMEEIYRIQKAYAIPDVELKEGLKNDNKEYIVPAYKLFREKYKNVNFTKNPEKYVKYTVEDIGRFIDKFFDSAA